MKALQIVVCCLCCLLVTVVAVQSAESATAKFYEDASCDAKSDSWIVNLGAYSKGAGEKYQELPFPNDEASSLDLPQGWSVYMTDGQWFDPEDNQVIWYEAKDRDLKCIPIGHKEGLMGKVSSVILWNHTTDPTPEEVKAKRPSLLPGEGMAAELPKAIFYENSGCQGGESWTVQAGVYSKGNEEYLELPFPNDEVRGVDLPQGLSVYLTDGARFDPNKNETVLIEAKEGDLKCAPIGHNHALAGKVSSVALWDHEFQPTPSVIPSR